jgi:exoribonuclease II
MPDPQVTHADLQEMARQIMIEHGFEPEFPAAVRQQVANIQSQSASAAASTNGVRDLRGLLWSSIDNDTSRDLDQIEAVEPGANGNVKVMVGIADVDAFVPRSCPIDDHAAKETTTVYTGVRNFPMLPEELSTGASSLLEDQDRLAMVIEFVAAADGTVSSGTVYPALVRNQAQLTYNAVGSWLQGGSAAPPKVAASPDLQQQLRLQNQVAQALKKQRFQHGALNIETNEVHPVLLNEQVIDIAKQEKNPATELIEDFMVAANGVVARLLEKVSSIRRIVRTPEKWDRIVQLAAQKGGRLPPQPDSKALNDFLLQQKQADPDHFADLSLAVIKLIGPGEYVLERPGDPVQGHFGLAVQDYTHSTAPNRRFADVVTQRLLKALIGGSAPPYSDDDLAGIARNCTDKEDAARKVEREMTKRVAAVMMSSHIGEVLDGIVTGVTPHGTFVRVMNPHVEGLLAQGAHGVNVGDRLPVKLMRTDIQRGYIDFARA